jgi:hypothetical protein
MSGDPPTDSEQRWLADENFNNDIEGFVTA